MRKLLLIVAIASTVVLQAQPPKEETRRGNDMEQIRKDLQLTEKQEADLTRVNDVYRQKMKAESEKNRESQKEIKKLRKEHQKEIKAVLTTEQYVKYLEKRNSRKRDEGKGKRQGKRK